MSFETMDALEVRVRRLVDLVQELQQTNQSLHRELSLVKEALSKHESGAHQWEAEREHIKARIEKVLGELDGLESPNGALEEVADGTTN